MDFLSRRRMLAGTAGGLAFASAASAAAAADSPKANSDPGPRDPRQEAINPSPLDPPPTDKGNIGTLKYSFSEAKNRHTPAGWAREVTVRNFPISKAMAGVNMRLPRGAVRELHWHQPGEWAYITYGEGRLTAIDPNAKKFEADFKAGDLWFFPSGVPHSIQGTGEDGCEFILVFNDGSFSEDSTFLITDWMAHTPKDVLAKNFNLPAATFDKVPKEELYIFDAPLPGTLAADLAQSKQPTVANSYHFRMSDVAPLKTAGGTVRIADVNNFPASNVMSAALVEVEPGGMRELHWHPMSDEWQYYISGHGRMTVFASGGVANTVDFAPSDVGYVPRSMGHYIENTGPDVLRFLEVFAVGQYSDVSLASWIANTPPVLVAAHLGIDVEVLKKLMQDKTAVVPA